MKIIDKMKITKILNYGFHNKNNIKIFSKNYMNLKNNF